ncbi:SDR family oxidoreductase [Chitinophaga ginsengisoli]|uniref:Nucleoside-diphosphate-sugar epimerase n=1 Tax=Chitinophaga ginsengisoli TaxID=363837 RepID=A0A2P8G4V2_9BACT|nr:NAD(P)H-binding protein [Chitinophaga ginsengisoli]PSL29010.1 nucleoside-diphosphate-sugar epimerase [Chitinophaga ginsengisoli]
MKIVVTGSLGNISKPLSIALIKQGHSVTVISSNPAKQREIEQLGAKASIGSLTDAQFVTAAFTGADAAYCMVPFDFSIADQDAHMKQIMANYVQAIRHAGIKRVIFLTGWAAEVAGHSMTEVYKQLAGVHVSELRPAIFYTNFYQMMDMMRGKGMIGLIMGWQAYGIRALFGRRGSLVGNYGGNDRIVLVAPEDIAAAAAEEFSTPVNGVKIRYVGSEELTCNEVAAILGSAIGKPWMKWIRISDKQMLQGYKMAGLPEGLAESLVQMQAAIHDGTILAEYDRHRPVLGKVKLKDFVREFAKKYI